MDTLGKAKRERLALLLEEMGEAQQAIGKILRHGYASTNPTLNDDVTNREQLEHELGDVLFAIELLCVTDLNEEDIDNARVAKCSRVWAYLWHQAEAKQLYTKRWPGTMARASCPHGTLGRG